jgi:ketosteroid isomerase-like protein
MSAANIAVARAAWAHLAQGHRSGEFAPYLAMLSEDYEFSIPVGPFRGLNRGKVRAEAFFAAVAAAKPNLTYREPIRVCASADTVVIEFDDDGDFGGYAYKNRIAASFDIRDGLITAYREYFGDIDLESIALMATAAASTEGS